MEKVYYKLIQIKGIGPSLAKDICTKLGISLHSSYNSLSPDKLDALASQLGALRAPGRSSLTPIEFALTQFNKKKILRLIELNTYRGRRHKQGYPVRGQRTRSNAQSAKKLNKSRLA